MRWNCLMQLFLAGQCAGIAHGHRARGGALPRRKDRARDLPPSVRSGRADAVQADACSQRNDLTVKEAEKQLIMRALKETDGNRTLAAQKIGMSRRTLHRKLHTYHLEGF